MNNHQATRQQINAQRQQQSPFQQLIATKRIAGRVRSLNAFKQAQHVALYWAVHGEINCSPLIDWCCKHNKHCYLPVLHPHQAGHLQFCRYEPHDRLKINRFGIAEPIVKPQKLIAPHLLDIVITPLLAFDQHGNRLGTGGGYYDRTFAFKKNQTPQKKPILIGVSYQFQKIDLLQPQPWDVSLQWVVTDQAVYRCD